MTNLNQQNKLTGNGFKLKNDSKSKVLSISVPKVLLSALSPVEKDRSMPLLSGLGYLNPSIDNFLIQKREILLQASPLPNICKN